MKRRRHRAADRLCRGSVALTRRGTTGAAEWARGGDRTRDTVLRVAVLAFVGWMTWRIVRAAPGLLWLAGPAWCIAAWRAAPAAADGQEKAPGEVDPQGPDEATAEPPLTALLRELIGDDRGVHLQELYPAMRGHLPGLAKAPDEQLRQVLTEAGIPVRRSTRSRGVAGRSGVHRDDLPPLPSPDDSPEPLSGPLSDSGDAGQGGDSPAAESGRREAGEGVRIVRDPSRGPTYHRVETA